MDYLKMHKGKLFNAYNSLKDVQQEKFIVNGNAFSIVDLEYNRHSKFDDLKINIQYKNKNGTLIIYAKENGIFNGTPYNDIGKNELDLTEKEYMVNNYVLKAVCKEIRLYTQNFSRYYSNKQEILEYLND